MRFVVVLDACVLYPAPLRDFLLRLATTGLFAAKWTDHIHEEWISSVLSKRPELHQPLKRTRELMDKAVPDSRITGHEQLIPGLELPDPDDRHVLAAAIVGGAQMIITFNTTDFPEDRLTPYGIEALHPDTFIEHQFGLHQGLVIGAAKRHRAALKHPPKSAEQYLDTLAAQGLVVTADLLREYNDLI